MLSLRMDAFSPADKFVTEMFLTVKDSVVSPTTSTSTFASVMPLMLRRELSKGMV